MPDSDEPPRNEAHLDESYSRLRQIAAGYLRQLRPGQTVQPTDLVHDAWLKIQQVEPRWHSRSQFLAFASKSIRNLLIDHVRARAAEKRGGDRQRVTLATQLHDGSQMELEFLALHEALEVLAQRDERQARIVEMRFFGDMSSDDIAEAIGVSPRTVRRELRMAQAWLMRELDSPRD